MPSHSDPPSSSSNLKWVREELREKANAEWAKAEHKALGREVKAVREVALKAVEEASKTYQCQQVTAIEKIKETLDSWKTVKVAVVISVLVLATGAVANHVALNAAVEENAETVIEVKESQAKMEQEIKTEIKTEVGALKTAIEKDKKNQDLREKTRRIELKETFKEVWAEVNGVTRLKKKR